MPCATDCASWGKSDREAAATFPKRVFKARVTFVAASLDPNTHRLPIHAEIANPDGLLKPEMFATFRIITGESSLAPAIPEAAIVYDPDCAHVWLAGPDQTLRIRKVMLGRNDSGLVEHRPDIQQADADVHSASALVGVAVANRLPLINLSAFGGSQVLKANQLFSPGDSFWTIAGSLTQPIFDGGILLHKERQARAAFEQAVEQYRSTVIAAFQSVADVVRALQALQADSDAVRVGTLAQKTADDTLAITGKQLQLGQISYLAFLNAEQVALQARLTAVQARASRLSDTAGLFQALGGGWWNHTDSQVKDSHGDDILGAGAALTNGCAVGWRQSWLSP